MRSNYDDDGFGGPMKPQMTDSVGAQPWNTPYAAPPRREWVGLTGTEINHIFAANVGYPERMMKEVEALLREKNG